MREFATSLAVLVAAATVTGCGGTAPSDVAFRSHVGLVCREANPILGTDPRTRAVFRKLRRTEHAFLNRLSRLHAPTAIEERAYRDLLVELDKVHSIFIAHESEFIKLAREKARLKETPADFRLVFTQYKQALRPMEHAIRLAQKNLSALRLTKQCYELPGL